VLHNSIRRRHPGLHGGERVDALHCCGQTEKATAGREPSVRTSPSKHRLTSDALRSAQADLRLFWTLSRAEGPSGHLQGAPLAPPPAPHPALTRVAQCKGDAPRTPISHIDRRRIGFGCSSRDLIRVGSPARRATAVPEIASGHAAANSTRGLRPTIARRPCTPGSLIARAPSAGLGQTRRAVDCGTPQRACHSSSSSA
jgi:hypothetical protein